MAAIGLAGAIMMAGTVTNASAAGDRTAGFAAAVIPCMGGATGGTIAYVSVQ